MRRMGVMTQVRSISSPENLIKPDTLCNHPTRPEKISHKSIKSGLLINWLARISHEHCVDLKKN
jgi:hypothetical protein